MGENQIRVLVVEDLAPLGAALRRSLEGAGYQAHGASNGAEGLKQYRLLRPDIVVTDLEMPQMDGLAMTRAIVELHPGAVIIAVSGSRELELALEAGAVAIFEKPVAPAVLIAAIEALLGLGEQALPPPPLPVARSGSDPMVGSGRERSSESRTESGTNL